MEEITWLDEDNSLSIINPRSITIPDISDFLKYAELMPQALRKAHQKTEAAKAEKLVQDIKLLRTTAVQMRAILIAL
jgi:hypothetical protein